MRTRHYHIAFSIALRHAYFADGKFATATLSPTEATAKLLQSRRILLRNRPGELIALAEAQPGDPAPLASLRTAQVKLEFALSCSDPEFANFTALPGHSYREGTFVFGNTPTPQTASSLSRQQAAAYAAGAPLPPRAAHTASSRLRLSAENTAGAADFSADPQDRIRGAFGLVVIETGALPTDGPADYTLDFAARATTWRYHIVPRGSHPNQSFAITNGKSDIKFNEQGPLSLINGTQAFVFEASETLSFQEKGMPTFSLRQTDDSSATPGEVLISSLPRPRYQDLKLEKASDLSRYIAEVYVYV